MVGRTPWSAADAPVGLLARYEMLCRYTGCGTGACVPGEDPKTRGPPHPLLLDIELWGTMWLPAGSLRGGREHTRHGGNLLDKNADPSV